MKGSGHELHRPTVHSLSEGVRSVLKHWETEVDLGAVDDEAVRLVAVGAVFALDFL